jgi:hypothetical protein
MPKTPNTIKMKDRRIWLFKRPPAAFGDGVCTVTFLKFKDANIARKEYTRDIIINWMQVFRRQVIVAQACSYCRRQYSGTPEEATNALSHISPKPI